MKLAILGATGSIGQSALDLADHFPAMEIVALACGRRVEALASAIMKHRPGLVAVRGPEERKKLETLLKDAGLRPRPDIRCGPEGQIAAAVESGAEVVLSAIVGGAGLPPTHAAVKKGLKVALANKESLVMAGDLIRPLAARAGATLLPVDSEHSAIFQALGGRLESPGVRRLILTASGGPFRGRKAADLEKVTLEEALHHPRWRMGPKITCDSATMMNKGLEIIEAHHLFGLPYARIEVVIHPQSVVHSLVEYVDGSQIAQLGPTDMRLAIAYALSHPDRWPLLPDGGERGLADLAPLELASTPFPPQRGHLTFEEPDRETFPALALAEAAGRTGGTAPTILTSANEEAVTLFLSGAVNFVDITRLVDQTLSTLPAAPLTSVEQALAAAEEARRLTRSFSLDLRR